MKISAASRSMHRSHDGLARDLGPGSSLPQAASATTAANDNHALGPSCSSALPSNAKAIIEPVPIGINQSGQGCIGMWRLRFAERWRPRPDPLTGWTGGGDPLAQIELRFADLEAAKRYCQREGVRFEIRGSPDLSRPAAPRLSGDSALRLCCWPTGSHARCCGDYPVDALSEGRRHRPVARHVAFSLAG